MPNLDEKLAAKQLPALSVLSTPAKAPDLSSLLQGVQEQLAIIAKISIPAVMKMSGNDTTYTYHTYFGLQKNPSSRVIASIDEIIHMRDHLQEHVAELKDPKEISQFKQALVNHLRYPKFYPDVPRVILKRETIGDIMDPLVKEFKKRVDCYIEALSKVAGVDPKDKENLQKAHDPIAKPLVEVAKAKKPTAKIA